MAGAWCMFIRSGLHNHPTSRPWLTTSSMLLLFSWRFERCCIVSKTRGGCRGRTIRLPWTPGGCGPLLRLDRYTLGLVSGTDGHRVSISLGVSSSTVPSTEAYEPRDSAAIRQARARCFCAFLWVALHSWSSKPRQLAVTAPHPNGPTGPTYFPRLLVHPLKAMRSATLTCPRYDIEASDGRPAHTLAVPR